MNSQNIQSNRDNERQGVNAASSSCRGYRRSEIIAELERRTEIEGIFAIDVIGAATLETGVTAKRNTKTPQGKEAALSLTTVIIDVPFYIEPYSELDTQAMERRETRYRPDAPNEYLYPLNILAAMGLTTTEHRLAVCISLWFDGSCNVIESAISAVKVKLTSQLTDSDVAVIYNDSTHPLYEPITALAELSERLAFRRCPQSPPYDPRSGLSSRGRSLSLLSWQELLPLMIRTEIGVLVNSIVAKKLRESKVPSIYIAQGTDVLRHYVPPDLSIKAVIAGLNLREPSPYPTTEPIPHSVHGTPYCYATRPARSYPGTVALTQLKSAVGLGPARPFEELAHFCQGTESQFDTLPAYGGQLVIQGDLGSSLQKQLQELSDEEFRIVLEAISRVREQEYTNVPEAEVLNEAQRRLQQKRLPADTTAAVIEAYSGSRSESFRAFKGVLVTEMLANEDFTRKLLSKVLSDLNFDPQITVEKVNEKPIQLFKSTFTPAPGQTQRPTAWANSESAARHGAEVSVALSCLGLKNEAQRLLKTYLTKSKLRTRQQMHSQSGPEQEFEVREEVSSALPILRHARKAGYIRDLQMQSERTEQRWRATIQISLFGDKRPPLRVTTVSSEKEWARAAASRIALNILISEFVVPATFGKLSPEWLESRGKAKKVETQANFDTLLTELYEEKLAFHSAASCSMFVSKRDYELKAVNQQLIGGHYIAGLQTVEGWKPEEMSPAILIDFATQSSLQKLDACGFGTGSLEIDYEALLTSSDLQSLEWESSLIIRRFTRKYTVLVTYPSDGGGLFYLGAASNSVLACYESAAIAVLGDTKKIWENEQGRTVGQLHREKNYLEALNEMRRIFRPFPFASQLYHLPESVQFYESTCSRTSETGDTVTTYGRGPTERDARRIAARKMCVLLGIEDREPWEHEDPTANPRTIELQDSTPVFREEEEIKVHSNLKEDSV